MSSEADKYIGSVVSVYCGDGSCLQGQLVSIDRKNGTFELKRPFKLVFFTYHALDSFIGNYFGFSWLHSLVGFITRGQLNTLVNLKEICRNGRQMKELRLTLRSSEVANVKVLKVNNQCVQESSDRKEVMVSYFCFFIHHNSILIFFSQLMS